MSLGYLLLILACIAMWCAAFNVAFPERKLSFGPVNFMCLSFALLLTAWFFGSTVIK